MRARRNSPSAASRRWLSLIASSPMRVAGLQPQFALNGGGLRARVADDEDVIDEDARPLAHDEHDVGTA